MNFNFEKWQIEHDVSIESVGRGARQHLETNGRFLRGSSTEKQLNR